MDHDDLIEALESSRSGAFAPSGRIEALPMRAPGDPSHRIAVRIGRNIASLLDVPWQTTVALAFSTDGERVAAAGSPSGVCVWQVKTGARLAHLEAPRPWRLGDGRDALPVRFAMHDQFLVIGGQSLVVVETSGWSVIPVADFPVVGIVSDFGGTLIIGPPENSAYPLECLALDSFTLSYRGSVSSQTEHPSTTQLDL